MIARPIAVGLVIGATAACISIAITVSVCAHVFDEVNKYQARKKSKTTNNAL